MQYVKHLNHWKKDDPAPKPRNWQPCVQRYHRRPVNTLRLLQDQDINYTTPSSSVRYCTLFDLFTLLGTIPTCLCFVANITSLKDTKLSLYDRKLDISGKFGRMFHLRLKDFAVIGEKTVTFNQRGIE